MFCGRRKVDPIRASVNDLLEFLTELFSQGLGYSAINTARSAVAAVVLCENGRSIGTDPRVVRFVKGVFELRTPKPKYHQVWDVSVLLEFLKSKGDNHSLSLKELSQKLCALLLLVSAQRVQSVHLIKLNDITFTEFGCSIILTDKLKHTKANNPSLARVWKIPRYNEKELCVVKCLEEYISKTKSLRSLSECNKLFLCYVKPHGAASKDTISRWMKDLLKEAGINDYGSHSFRGATTSAMYKSGIPLDDIILAAGWSNATTFQKFYNKPIEKKGTVSKTIMDFFCARS